MNATDKELLEALGGEGKHRCPLPGHANEDENPSLNVTVGASGKLLTFCHGTHENCIKELREWLKAAGKSADDAGEAGAGATPPGTPVSIQGSRSPAPASYTYVDEGGTLLFTVHRGAGKKFTQVPASGKRGRGAMQGV